MARHSSDFESLQATVKEMVRIQLSIAKEMSSDREERNREVHEIQERIDAMELGSQANRSQVNSSSSSQSKSQTRRLPQGKQDKRAVADSGGSLELVMGGLERLQETVQRPPSSPSPRPSRALNVPSAGGDGRHRESSQASQGSASEDGNTWSAE